MKTLNHVVFIQNSLKGISSNPYLYLILYRNLTRRVGYLRYLRYSKNDSKKEYHNTQIKDYQLFSVSLESDSSNPNKSYVAFNFSDQLPTNYPLITDQKTIHSILKSFNQLLQLLILLYINSRKLYKEPLLL